MTNYIRTYNRSYTDLNGETITIKMAESDFDRISRNCERQITWEGEKNDIDEDVICQAVEMFDKGVRRSVLPLPVVMQSVIEMMLETKQEID